MANRYILKPCESRLGPVNELKYGSGVMGTWNESEPTLFNKQRNKGVIII
jgi:hypothetical protein